MIRRLSGDTVSSQDAGLSPPGVAVGPQCGLERKTAAGEFLRFSRPVDYWEDGEDTDVSSEASSLSAADAGSWDPALVGTRSRRPTPESAASPASWALRNAAVQRWLGARAESRTEERACTVATNPRPRRKHRQKRIAHPAKETMGEDDPHPLQSDESESDCESDADASTSPPVFRKRDDDQVRTKTHRLVSNLTASLRNITLSRAASAVSALERVERLNMANVMAFERRGVVRHTDEPRPRPVVAHRARPLTTFNVQETLLWPQFRPREPRLNSSFYRVYAVESCMRRAGKFDENFLGRAQLVCEPRRDGNQRVYLVDEEQEVFGIRKRFVSKFDRPDVSTTLVSNTVPARWRGRHVDDNDASSSTDSCHDSSSDDSDTSLS